MVGLPDGAKKFEDMCNRLDQWCLRRILRISWRARISNEEVRRRTDQPPLTQIIHTARLKFFGMTR